MLEGQVAVLSSGLLGHAEAAALLKSLRRSDLYRADQNSYMLYPEREPPGFLVKNNVTPDQVAGSSLAAALTAAGDRTLLIRDDTGVYHFPGGFRNAADVEIALDTLAQDEAYSDLVEKERGFIFGLFEVTFNHRAFTGRSGTFFAYEGLGSIYWHMVSKLLLAAQECHLAAKRDGADPETVAALASAYQDIRQGLGYNKPALEYGAFPTDPYSHTPAGGGARQPGMTGQVKEDILSRWGELGVSIHQGEVGFAPALLPPDEFMTEPSSFDHVDVNGQQRTLALPHQSLAFTFCQVPVIYMRSEVARIEVTYAGGRSATFMGNRLDAANSEHLFQRDGQIEKLWVSVEI